MKLDRINCLILNMLQKNCRLSLTNIAREVGLSVDAVKKRVDKMVKEDIFFPKIQLRPRHFGFNNIVDVRMKLRHHTYEDLKRFISFLREHPRVVEVFSTSGAWDFSVVLIAKDGEDLGSLTESIRDKFSPIIAEWSESLTTFAHKFEEYDMLALGGHT